MEFTLLDQPDTCNERNKRKLLYFFYLEIDCNQAWKCPLVSPDTEQTGDLKETWDVFSTSNNKSENLQNIIKKFRGSKNRCAGRSGSHPAATSAGRRLTAAEVSVVSHYSYLGQAVDTCAPKRCHRCVAPFSAPSVKVWILTMKCSFIIFN